MQLHFQSAMRDCPGIVAKIPAFFYGVGTCQAVIGQLDAALSNFRKYEAAIKHGNFRTSALQSMMLSFNIGQTLVRMQRDEEAMTSFRAVFAQGADDAAAAAAAAAQSDDDDRKQQQAVVAASHYWAALAAQALRAHKETVAHLTEFESRVAGSAVDEALLEEGWRERYKSRLIKAKIKSDPEKHMGSVVLLARDLCELDPENPIYQRVLAECLFNAGDVPAAADAYKRFLHMSQTGALHDINVLLNLARCLHDMGHLDESHAYFSQVLAQQPSHADAILGLAAVGIAKLRRRGDGRDEEHESERASAAAPLVAAHAASASLQEGGMRTPREQWMEREIEAASASVKGKCSEVLAGGEGGVYGSGREGDVPSEVGDALVKLRRVLKNKSGAAAIAVRAEALVLEAELQSIVAAREAHSLGRQEMLLQEALRLCPHHFQALLRLAAIFHEKVAPAPWLRAFCVMDTGRGVCVCACVCVCVCVSVCVCVCVHFGPISEGSGASQHQ
jgi:tetratricopeptide (TPR) repeat protein